jgi:hypothetical protein
MHSNSSDAKRVSDDTSDYLIDRLVEEMTDAVSPDDGRDARPDLTTLEDRLTQLRESPEDAVAPLGPFVPPMPVVAPEIAPHPPAPQHVAPAGLGGKQRPAGGGDRGAAGVDAVILEAAASSGIEPIYLDDKASPGRQPRTRHRKRRGSLSFYLMVLLLLGFSYALFVLYKPTLEKLIVLPVDHSASAAAIVPCDIGASSQGRSDATTDVGLCTSATTASVQPRTDPPVVIAQNITPPDAQNIAPPELPAIYRNERLVKTYRVGADGKIAFVPDTVK